MKFKILTVEDDVNLLETLRYNLVREGYNVITASDGTKALDIAVKEEFREYTALDSNQIF